MNSTHRSNDRLPDPMAVPLGKAIKTFRLGRRLTQAKLASIIPGNITQGHISKIEKGGSFPSNKAILAITNALGCTHQELWAMAETFSETESYESLDAEKEALLECLYHKSLNLSSERVKSLEALLSKENVLGKHRHA